MLVVKMKRARIHSYNIECPNCYLFHIVPATTKKTARCSHCREVFIIPLNIKAQQKEQSVATRLAIKMLKAQGFRNVEDVVLNLPGNYSTIEHIVRAAILELSKK